MTDWKSEYESEHEKRLADKARIAKLEAKLQLTEGAFKNTRIRELEAQLANVLAANQHHCGMLSECGVRIRELESLLREGLKAEWAPARTAFMWATEAQKLLKEQLDKP